MHRAYTEIRRNHVLGYAVVDAGKNLRDVFVALRWCKQVLVFEPVVKVYEVVFSDKPAHLVALR